MSAPTGPRIYNLFPLLVGTVDDWRDHLPRIAGMGFDWIFVSPFHLTGGLIELRPQEARVFATGDGTGP